MKGRVVVVVGGGNEQGRAVALALAARGAKVVVTGGPEKDLAETVGYIVFGGGQARHHPGDLEGAIEKARRDFGGEPVVVPEGLSEAEALARFSDPPRAP